MTDTIQIVDERCETGSSYRLQRRGQAWEIFIDGQLAMSSMGPRPEEAIVDLALAPWGARDDVTVLLAGVGMGQLCRALLNRPHIKHMDVVEQSETILDWARGPLAAVNGGALADRRVRVIQREILDYLSTPTAPHDMRPTGWFITILNTDDWPVSLSHPENVSLYHEDGIAVFEATLRPSGVFVTHTICRDDGLESRLRERFQSVARIGVPVELGAETELQYVYRGRRSSIGGGAG